MRRNDFAIGDSTAATMSVLLKELLQCRAQLASVGLAIASRKYGSMGAGHRLVDLFGLRWR
jgi:hypothetical protein